MRLQQYLSSFSKAWLVLGLLVFVCAFFLSPDRAVVKRIGLLFIALPALFFFAAQYKNTLKTFLSREFLAICLFFLWILISLFFNKEGEDGIRIARYLLCNLIYIAALFLLFSEYPVIPPRFISWVGLAASISTLIIWFNFVQKNGVGYIGGTQGEAVRFSGIGAMRTPIDASYMYSFLAIYIYMALESSVFKNNLEKYLNVFNLIVVISFIVASGTRAALVSVVLMYISFFLHQKKKGSFAAIGLGGGLIACCFLYVWIEAGRGFSYRLELWALGVKYAAEKFMFGHGSLRLPYQMMDGSVYWHPHNEFINLVVVCGLPGLVLFLLLYKMAFSKISVVSYFNNWTIKASVCALIFAFITMMFSANKIFGKFDEFYVYFWLPLVFLMTRASFAQKNEPHI